MHHKVGSAFLLSILLCYGLELNADGAQPRQSSAPLTGIHQAAWAGDMAQVRALLDQNPLLVNAVASAGWTPLHFAAQQGHQDVAALLLDRGANIKARLNYQGGTPLHVAASTGRKSLVELLLARGADVNSRDDDGWTPLHRAAIKGSLEIAELLLAKGADVNAMSNGGVLPMDQAIQMQNNDFAQFILRHTGRGGYATLLLADNFSGDCLWPSGENAQSGFSFGCHQGAYRMRLKNAGPDHIKRNFRWGTQSLSAEVDATVATGRGTEPGTSLLGIGCLSDENHGYVTILKTDGAWAIMRLEDGFTQLAGSNKAGGIPGLLPTNRLRIVCAGGSGKSTVVSFFVNGQAVASVQDEKQYAPFNGVLLYADTFPGDVIFDRFVAREPPKTK